MHKADVGCWMCHMFDFLQSLHEDYDELGERPITGRIIHSCGSLSQYSGSGPLVKIAAVNGPPTRASFPPTFLPYPNFIASCESPNRTLPLYPTWTATTPGMRPGVASAKCSSLQTAGSSRIRSSCCVSPPHHAGAPSMTSLPGGVP